MRIIFGVPVYNRYDLLERLVESVWTGSLKPNELYVVNNGKSPCRVKRARVFNFPQNLGCAGAWNFVFERATSPDDIVVVSNDDAEILKDGLEQIVKKITSSEEDLIVLGSEQDQYGPAHSWSLYGMRSRTWRRIGGFDERFRMAYLEDTDYEYRAKLLGVKICTVPAMGKHIEGGTFKLMNDQEKARMQHIFNHNREYFERKWGGGPRRETLRSPHMDAKFTKLSLDEMFWRDVQEESDIQEHLWALRTLGSQVERICEFGVRTGRSTRAFLAARPRNLVSYDLEVNPEVKRLENIRGRTKFAYRKGDSRKVTIEPVDLLFIDTLHVYEQLKTELSRHHEKVRRWIVLHDTSTFGERGEIPGSRGLWKAVQEFTKSCDWRVKERYTHNNGLTILERT